MEYNLSSRSLALDTANGDKNGEFTGQYQR